MADVRLSRRALMTGALATAAAVALPVAQYASGGPIKTPPMRVRWPTIVCERDLPPRYFLRYFVSQAQWDAFKATGCDMTRDFVLVGPIPEC